MRQEADLGRWRLTEEFVQDYFRAVGDRLPVYAQLGLVPGVALAARALGFLLDRLDLPPGAIHSLQEIDSLKSVCIGQEISASSVVDEPRRRSGMEFITAVVALKNGDGEEVLTSKSTVLVIDSVEAGLEDDKAKRETQPGVAVKSSRVRDDAPETANKSLPTISKTISQDQLGSYARVSGDSNPLHLDPEFAAKTQFGGIIAHGMLTLAFISEMMASAFGQAWLETGRLKVRFKGAAYLGETVETVGNIAKKEQYAGYQEVTCGVGVRELESGRELVSGSAKLLL